MSDKKKQKLLQKRQKLVDEISFEHTVIKGSLVELKRTCGKPNCRCLRGEKHQSLYISQSYKGKTRMIYIPKKYEHTVRAAVANHKKILHVLNKLSEITIQFIKDREEL